MSAAKHALIFGGTRGIGLAVARRFLDKGFNVSVISRSQTNVDSAVTMLNKRVEKPARIVVGYTCNVADETSVSAVFKEVQKKNMSVDVLVNAAAINEDSLLVNSSAELLHNIVTTNLLGTMFTSKHCLKFMLRQKAGSIITFGSIVGIKGNVGQCAYSASKAGIIGFVKSLAKEVSPKGITVNMVCPGFIQTELTANISATNIVNKIPLKRFGNTDEVAESVLFLANSAFITGEVLVVDGGLSLQI